MCLARGAQPPSLAGRRRPGGGPGLSGASTHARKLALRSRRGPFRGESLGRALSVAVASFQPAAVVYREEQNFAWWVYVFVGLVEALGWMTLFLLLQNVRNLTSPESIPALA